MIILVRDCKIHTTWWSVTCCCACLWDSPGSVKISPRLWSMSVNADVIWIQSQDFGANESSLDGVMMESGHVLLRHQFSDRRWSNQLFRKTISTSIPLTWLHWTQRWKSRTVYWSCPPKTQTLHPHMAVTSSRTKCSAGWCLWLFFISCDSVSENILDTARKILIFCFFVVFLYLRALLNCELMLFIVSDK